MKKEDEKLLEDDGWQIDCESPFEISKTDDENGGVEIGFARGVAADMILDKLRKDAVTEKKDPYELNAEELAKLKTNFMEAIKMYRYRTGVDLRTAKGVVDKARGRA